jgi:hypothetical protein
LALSAVVVVLLLTMVVWRFSGSDSGPAMSQNDRAMAPAERRKREKLREIDPLTETPAYVRSLETLKPKTIRAELTSVGASAPERRQILRKVMMVAKRPFIRDTSVALLRGQEGGLSDDDIMTLSQDPDSSPIVRSAMANEIQERHMWKGVPELIRGMRDGDSRVRGVASKAFQKLFGVGHEFDPNDRPEEREKVVQMIEQAFPKFKKHFDASKERAENQRKIDEKL